MSSSTDKDAKPNDEDVADETDTGTGDTDAVFDDEELVAAPPRRSRLQATATFAAVVLSIAALGLAGWQLATTRQQLGELAASNTGDVAGLAVANEAAVDRLRSQVAELTSARDAARLAQATLEERIAQMAATDGTVAADVDTLERRLEQRLDLIDSIPARVASMERSISSLRGMSTGAQDAWLLSQAEYFLQIANAELELSRNPAVAEQALRMADERLVEVDDPGLTDVRRQLSAELQSLEALDMPDIAGTAVTLASLSRIVDSLPIREELLTRRPDDESEPDATSDEAEGGFDRAMSTLGDAFSGFIDIRRTDEAARPLMAPEAVYFLRANLALQLQAARLSLLTGEQALFEQSLDDAIAWLGEYYDTTTTPVQSALATMNDIRLNPISGDYPDISASLRLLRQYIAFRGADQDDDVAAEPQPESEPAQ